jgi:hypothetical protein
MINNKLTNILPAFGQNGPYKSVEHLPRRGWIPARYKINFKDVFDAFPIFQAYLAHP